MKKWIVFSILPAVLLVAGCGWNKIDITDTDFDVESCDRYFELVDCILNNDSDETYSPEMRDEIRQEVKNMQDGWNSYSDDELDSLCTAELDKFSSIESTLDEIGCSIK